MPDDDYDWADDDTLSPDEIMGIFEALGPDIEITGPPDTSRVPNELTFTYAATTKTEAFITPVVDVSFAPGHEPVPTPTA